MKKLSKKKILLKGVSACPGVVAEEAFIIKNPSRITKIKKGMIIVAPFTTPILAPIISEAAGLITEIGGLTCHAAVISREFALPCIVGALEATKILKNNQQIILDADKGVVYDAE